ncbi:MAG: hypothetical protein LBL73_02845 [Synergistaceae bacterium]|jgi:hypothetical protein|nr:hypothetical protein [Synergistaceae bacterium]
MSVKDKEDQAFAFKIIIIFVSLLSYFTLQGHGTGPGRSYMTDTYYAIGVLEYLGVLIQQNNSTLNLLQLQSGTHDINAFIGLINFNKEISETDIENEIINSALHRYTDDYLDQLEQRMDFRMRSLEWEEGAINGLRRKFKICNDEYFKNIEIFIKKDGKAGIDNVFIVGLIGGRMDMKRLEGFFTGYIYKIDKVNHYYSNNYYHFRNKYRFPSYRRTLSKRVII